MYEYRCSFQYGSDAHEIDCLLSLLQAKSIYDSNNNNLCTDKGKTRDLLSGSFHIAYPNTNSWSSMINVKKNCCKYDYNKII